MLSASPANKRLIVHFTDGRHNTGPALQPACDGVIAAGIDMWGLGVGGGADIPALEACSGDPSKVGVVGTSDRQMCKMGATNGSSMRVAPAGLVHPGDIEGACQTALITCLPSHNTQIAISAACAIAAGVARDFSGSGPSSLWGHGDSAGPADAAMVNGTAVHGFEIDDIHVESMFHPGAVTIPAVPE